ncbi:hypothetical protein T484DRAFT_1939933, partial [Baffinella frigidus]
MDDQNNQSLVLSRQGLLTVPIEVFTTAAKRPLRCLDLGYNRLETDEVAALGDLEERVLHSRMGSSRGLASQGSMRGQTPISPGGVHLATLRGAAASGGRPYSSMSAADSILGARVPNSRVSTGSVWYHEQSDEAAKLKHLEVLYLSNNALAAIPEELGNLLTLKSLWLDANAITLIPPAISKLEKLQVLSLSHNMLLSDREPTNRAGAAPLDAATPEPAQQPAALPACRDRDARPRGHPRQVPAPALRGAAGSLQASRARARRGAPREPRSDGIDARGGQRCAFAPRHHCCLGDEWGRAEAQDAPRNRFWSRDLRL